MNKEELSERLVTYSARFIKLAEALPKTTAGNHICVQLVHSGTSGGANYNEACAAESNADFTHKLSIALKELRESKYWLRVILKSEYLSSKRMENILKETDELCKIIGKSIVTIKSKRTANKS